MRRGLGELTFSLIALVIVGGIWWWRAEICSRRHCGIGRPVLISWRCVCAAE